MDAPLGRWTFARSLFSFSFALGPLHTEQFSIGTSGAQPQMQKISGGNLANRLLVTNIRSGLTVIGVWVATSLFPIFCARSLLWRISGSSVWVETSLTFVHHLSLAVFFGFGICQQSSSPQVPALMFWRQKKSTEWTVLQAVNSISTVHHHDNGRWNMQIFDGYGLAFKSLYLLQRQCSVSDKT